MQQDEQKSTFCVCPRCHQKTYKDEQFCRNCGFDISSKEEKTVKTSLSFGLKDEIDVINDQTTELSFTQKQTKMMKFFQKLQDIAIVVIGVLSMMMIFMPIFSGNNMWSFIKQALESGYKFQVFEFLSFNENDNMLSLIKPLSEYVKIQDKMINPSLFVFLYELIVFVLSLLIVLLGAVLLFIGVKNLVFKHGFKYYKILISIVMAFSLVLIFVLGCFGIGPIILSIFSFLTLILFYVSDIVSKEKRFVLRHLIHKSICAILLFLLLSFSSFGLVKLNAELGVNLYSFAPYPVSGDISAPIYFSCKGIFYEFMQFIQCSSGDDMFTSISFAFCLLTFIAHFLYITFIVIAICNLIRGLSKQNLRFPVVFVVASTVAFYAFATFSIIFNQFINDAMYQKFVGAIGAEIVEQYTNAQMESSRLYNRIFIFKKGMIISLILNLPVCIYSIIASSICYKKYS